MALAITFTRAQIGINAPLVTVETHMVQGLPQILIVGMPETSVRESKDRVRAAIMNSGFEIPGRKFTVNLAPAELPKQGGRYDLPIAATVLEACNALDGSTFRNFELLGELALDGTLRGVTGALPCAIANAETERMLIVPRDNAAEAAIAASDNVRVADTLLEVVAFLKGHVSLEKPAPAACGTCKETLEISDIRGQLMAKRALTIAAAGAHNLLFMGPPGTGKTMLARRLTGLLPAPETREALEIASIQSVSSRGFDPDEWQRRPFCNPHHTASAVALVGGSNPPKPGEVSLAHHGVLFLDELPEFSRHVLEVLREPIESGEIVISRANRRVTYPSRFQLIAAMNPCPCGYFGDESARCNCGIDQIETYRRRVSGPLLDRIDLHVEVPPLRPGTLSEPFTPCTDEHNKAVLVVNRSRQLMRLRSGKPNAYLSSREVERICQVEPRDRKMLDHALQKLGLSTRAYYKVLKIARTIADMSESPAIQRVHLTEALAYRQLDRKQPA